MDEYLLKRKAVALGYEPNKDAAPRVLAKGKGFLAQKIIEAAKRYGIPLKEDRDLVELLAQVELEREIPPALYQVVAEVLAFIYRLKRKAP